MVDEDCTTRRESGPWKVGFPFSGTSVDDLWSGSVATPDILGKRALATTAMHAANHLLDH